MCRLLGYVGAPVRLRALCFDGTHALYAQSYRPREMLSGTVNVDGFGVAWFAPSLDPAPARYVSSAPLWADPNIASLGRVVETRCALAVVRGATDGMPFGPDNTPPFTDLSLAFAHNGAVRDFSLRLARPLRAALGVEREAALRGATDSEHFFALLREHRARTPDAPLATSVRAMLAHAVQLLHDARVAAQLNVLVADGTQLVAARCAVEGPAPSLYVCDGVTPLGAGSLIASERVADGAAWRVVPEQHLVIATADGAQVDPL